MKKYLAKPLTLQNMLILDFMIRYGGGTVVMKTALLIGRDMCYWLITESDQIISKSSVQHVIKDDFLNPIVKEAIEKINKKLVERLNYSKHHVELPEGAEIYRLPDVPLPDDLEYDGRDECNIPHGDEHGDMLVDERPNDDEEEMIDKYLGMEFIMDVGTNNERGARVVKRART